MGQLGKRFETFNKALGFYSHALGALERDEFDLSLLDDLKHPLPELVDFTRCFCALGRANYVAPRTSRGDGERACDPGKYVASV